MRKSVAALMLFSMTAVLSAQRIDLGEISRFNKFMDQVNFGSGGLLTYGQISGSPFYNANFTSGKVDGHTDWVPLRYNIFKDEVEVLNGTDVYVMPKQSTLSRFVFKDSHDVLVLADSGYFFELVNGKNKLLKKEKAVFVDEVKAANTYTAGTPPRFNRQKPQYFIKNDTDFIDVSKNEKNILNFFPDKKADVADFIKKNKIKLNPEADLIKLVQFLNK